MANLAVDAILERLRELVSDGAGTVRTVTSGRFSARLPPGLTADEERRRGVEAAKPAEVSIVGYRPHPQRLARLGTVQVHLLDVEVRIVRQLAVTEQVNQELRDNVVALAIEDGDALRQVFEIPSNLHTTSTARATGLIGCEHTGTRAVVTGDAGKASQVATVHAFTFTATSSPA